MSVLQWGEEFSGERQNYQSGRWVILFGYFMNPAEAPAAKTHSSLSTFFKIRQASLTADFQSKVNTTLTRMVRYAKTDAFFRGGGGPFFYFGESQKS